jgi:hypothetical protein
LTVEAAAAELPAGTASPVLALSGRARRRLSRQLLGAERSSMPKKSILVYLLKEKERHIPNQVLFSLKNLRIMGSRDTRFACPSWKDPHGNCLLKGAPFCIALAAAKTTWVFGLEKESGWRGIGPDEAATVFRRR